MVVFVAKMIDTGKSASDLQGNDNLLDEERIRKKAGHEGQNVIDLE